LERILELFFKIHNPTTKNREGPDIGSQYRSIILYQTEHQEKAIEKFIKNIQRDYSDEIVTDVRRLDKFYLAEEQHQDYFKKNPENAYCRINAQPKVEKAKNF